MGSLHTTLFYPLALRRHAAVAPGTKQLIDSGGVSRNALCYTTPLIGVKAFASRLLILMREA